MVLRTVNITETVRVVGTIPHHGTDGYIGGTPWYYLVERADHITINALLQVKRNHWVPGGESIRGPFHSDWEDIT